MLNIETLQRIAHETKNSYNWLAGKVKSRFCSIYNGKGYCSGSVSVSNDTNFPFIWKQCGRFIIVIIFFLPLLGLRKCTDALIETENVWLNSSVLASDNRW